MNISALLGRLQTLEGKRGKVLVIPAPFLRLFFFKHDYSLVFISSSTMAPSLLKFEHEL